MTALTDYESGLIGLDALIRLSAEARAAARREHGIVYTPLDLARAMVRMADVRVDDRVWEPSCGHGGFVFPLIERAFAMCGSAMVAKSWFRERVLATDIDPDTVEDLRAILAAYFRRAGVPSAPEDFPNVRAMDALREGFDERFSLTIGNPPYVRTREMDPDLLRGLRGRFGSMGKGNVDLYYAFIERAVALSERAVLIVPNACLTASGAAALRRLTFPRLREVRDFGAGLPFGDARAYVAILRFGPGEGPASVREGLDGPVRQEHWTALARDDLRGAPSVALSGIATLSDKSFILEERGGLAFSPVTGEAIEHGVVRPLIKVTKPNERRLILHPYAGKAPLPEAVMAADFPAAMRHFEAVRGALLARDKGKTEGYPAWYAYGRSQGLHDLSDRRILMVPVMIGGGAVPFLLDTRALTRAWGAPLFTSGFAVPAESDATGSLLTEDFREYVREVGRPKPGGQGELFHSISSRHVNAWLAREA